MLKCFHLDSILISITGEDAMGKLIRDSLIPSIFHLREKFPIRFSTLFMAGVLETHGLVHSIEAGDLELSDRLFAIMPKQ